MHLISQRISTSDVLYLNARYAITCHGQSNMTVRFPFSASHIPFTTEPTPTAKAVPTANGTETGAETLANAVAAHP